jgi:hypothetical protein
VTTDSRREILGTKLGTEFWGVYVKGLENIERGNIGDEEIPRQFDQIRTVIDAIGYVIAWPSTHVSLFFISFQIVHVAESSSN